MNRFIHFLVILFFFWLLIAPPAKAQGTYTAASCNQSDVNAVINGPSHIAVNGDIIRIPAGACIWTSGIMIPTGIGITVIGNGTPTNSPGVTGASSSCQNTQITWAIGSSAMFAFSPGATSSTTRISCFEVVTTGTVSSSVYPFTVYATCSSSTCPQLRFDNMTVPSGTLNHVSDGTVLGVNNVFGVADHNTIGDVSIANNAPVFINGNNSTWLSASGSYGDLSWNQPDTFGTNQAFYLENNSFNYAIGTDCDLGNGGGCRITCRFNVFNNALSVGACTNHGTESTGRARGGRQMEAYENSVTCTNTSQGCSTAFGMRSGVGRIFNNLLTAQTGSWFNYITYMTDYRRFAGVGTQFGNWGICDGAGNYDTNDGTTYYSGTVAVTSSSSFSDSAQTWTATFGVSTWAQTAAANGTPYSIIDTTQGFGAEIASVSGNNLTFTNWPICTWSSQSNCTFKIGDSYQIKRATACLDQPARSGGALLSGNPATLTSANGQSLDPNYEWGDTVTGSLNQAPSGSQFAILIRNRDFYYENKNQSAQTSATSPFDGTTAIGMGHGTLANRPTTCTEGVGYWATDQGTWNQSGGSNPASYNGQGELFICGTNGWPSTPSYTPYTYPHPLTGCPVGNPGAPCGLTASVNTQ